jgi:hypothetical protein
VKIAKKKSRRAAEELDAAIANFWYVVGAGITSIAASLATPTANAETGSGFK